MLTGGLTIVEGSKAPVGKEDANAKIAAIGANRRRISQPKVWLDAEGGTGHITIGKRPRRRRDEEGKRDGRC